MATKYDGDATERRALDVLIKLSRAAESVGERTTRHITASGMSVSQFGILDALYHLGPLTLGELARKHLRSRNNLTTVVDNMEKRNLVRRERQTDDRRMVRVHLTDEGRARFESLFPLHVQALVQEVSVLSPEEQNTLADLLKRLGRQEQRQ